MTSPLSTFLFSDSSSEVLRFAGAGSDSGRPAAAGWEPFKSAGWGTLQVDSLVIARVEIVCDLERNLVTQIGSAKERAQRGRRQATNGTQAMSKDTPNDDPRQRTDQKSFKQTDEPWKEKPEKEQRSRVSKDDLEKWHRTDTH